jgi:hypothetical protein
LQTSTVEIDAVLKQLVSVLSLVQQFDNDKTTATAINTAANTNIGSTAAAPLAPTGGGGKSKAPTKAPANAAATGALKLIMGLRQVTQYITRHNRTLGGDPSSPVAAVPGAIPGAADLKLVLLAPDTESSAELDKQILKLVQVCGSHSSSLNPHGPVPILYCMSRRQLGKVCQSSLRQAAVGVISITPVSATDPAIGVTTATATHVFNTPASIGVGGRVGTAGASATAAAAPSVQEAAYYQQLLATQPPLTAQILLQNVPQVYLVGYCRWLYGRVVDFINR